MQAQEKYNQNRQHFVDNILLKIINQIQSGLLHVSTIKKHVDHRNSRHSQLKTQSNQSNSLTKKQKSSLSLQDRKLLHKLTEKLHNFQGLLSNKSQLIKKAQLQMTKQEMHQMLQKRKTQSQKNRQRLVSRKHKRYLERLYQQQKKRQLKEYQDRTNMKSRLYVITQAQHQQKMREEQQQRRKLLTVMSQHKNSLVKISKIKEYESQYINYMRLQKQQRKNKLRRMRQSQRILEEISKSKSSKSKYYLRVQQEIELEKGKLQQQEKRKLQKKGKLKQFLSRIIRPSFIVPKKQSKKADNPASRRVQRSYTQQKQLGNRFMKQSFMFIKSNKAQVLIRKQSTVDESTRAEKSNYIQQMKEKRLKNKNLSINNIVAHSRTAVSKMIDSSDNSHQKIERIKRLAHRLQAGVANEDPYVQIQKIKAKMFILQSALNNQDA